MKKIIFIFLCIILILLFSCDFKDNSTDPVINEYGYYNVAICNSIHTPFTSVIYDITISLSESDSLVVIDSLEWEQQSEFYTFQYSLSDPKAQTIIITYLFGDETITETLIPSYEYSVIHARGTHYIELNEDGRFRCDISFINETENVIDSLWFSGLDTLEIPIYTIIDILPQYTAELQVFVHKYLYEQPYTAYYAGGCYISQSQLIYLVGCDCPWEVELTYHILPYGNYILNNHFEYSPLQIQFINDSQYDLTGLSCHIYPAVGCSYSIPDILLSGEESIVYNYFITNDIIPPNDELEISGSYDVGSLHDSYSITPSSLSVKIHFVDDGYWVEE